MANKLNPPQIETSLPPLIAKYAWDNNKWVEGSEEIQQECDSKINEQYKLWRDNIITSEEFHKRQKEIMLHYQNLIQSYTLTLPLYSNPSVAEGDFNQIAILIKTVSTGEVKETLIVDLDENIRFNDIIVINTFTASYMVGQYYKLQMAYVNNNEVGYYSSVGIFKCTAQPKVSIKDLIPNKLNYNAHSFTGIYQSEKDRSEKVYSYCFTIKDMNGLYDTSGLLLHNVNNDTDDISSINTWTPNKILQDHVQYSVSYKVTTINGVELTTPEYVITIGQDGYIDNEGSLIATLDYENGCVDLHFKNLNNTIASLEAGDYIITRASNKDNFNHWTQLTKIVISNDIENPTLLKDYSVEQGVSYQYGLQLIKPSEWLTARKDAIYYLNYEDEKYNRNQQENILVDFEDAYLFDGERQLCIKYNPKVASFKPTLLESKTDTLGGKYPFIFRNGNVNYKEFSISGLISMLMDENNSFISAAPRSENPRRQTPSRDKADDRKLTNLTGENFYKEREFKLEVLNWLTNGEPKLFRSPGEGNYIIRTINTSLSPNDTLGRMLHTFTCTAYEIADFTMNNLYKYKFLPEQMKIGKEKIMIFNEKLLKDIEQNENGNYTILPSGLYYFVRFENQYTSCSVSITFKNGDTEVFNISNSTGDYTIQGLKDNPIVNIQLEEDYYPYIKSTAKITYGYYGKSFNLSHDNEPYSVEAKTVVEQHVGCAEGLDTINSSKEMNYCYLIKLTPKPVINVVKIDDNEFKYAYINEKNEIIESDETIVGKPHMIYRILKSESSNDAQYVCGSEYFNNINYTVKINNTTTSLQPYNQQQFIDTFIQSNDSQYLADNGQVYLIAKNYEQLLQKILKTGARFTSIKNVGQLQELSIGNGVICEIVYETLEKKKKGVE